MSVGRMGVRGVSILAPRLAKETRSAKVLKVSVTPLDYKNRVDVCNAVNGVLKNDLKSICKENLFMHGTISPELFRGTKGGVVLVLRDLYITRSVELATRFASGDKGFVVMIKEPKTIFLEPLEQDLYVPEGELVEIDSVYPSEDVPESFREMNKKEYDTVVGSVNSLMYSISGIMAVMGILSIYSETIKETLGF